MIQKFRVWKMENSQSNTQNLGGNRYDLLCKSRKITTLRGISDFFSTRESDKIYRFEKLSFRLDNNNISIEFLNTHNLILPRSNDIVQIHHIHKYALNWKHHFVSPTVNFTSFSNCWIRIIPSFKTLCNCLSCKYLGNIQNKTQQFTWINFI